MLFKKFILSLGFLISLFKIGENLKIRSNELTTLIEEHFKIPHEKIFEIWTKLYKKKYNLDSKEGLKRFKTFSDNLQKIKKHNSNNSTLYKIGINQFSDLTYEEFMLYNKGKLKMDIKSLDELEKIIEINIESIWEPIDWRPIMLPVRDQGSCDTWWAFSVTGLIESIYWIKNKDKKNAKNEWLSPQQLIDCQTKMSGCYGGYFPDDADKAINYYRVRGAMREKDYNYTSQEGYMCYYNETLVKNMGISSRINKATNRIEIYNLLKNGPVLTAVGQNEEFKNYKGGIFDGLKCNDTRYNMGALLVGYGEEKGIGYWIVRMSWGKNWGEEGYIRVKVNSGNDCLIPFNGYQIELDN